MPAPTEPTLQARNTLVVRKQTDKSGPSPETPGPPDDPNPPDNPFPWMGPEPPKPLIPIPMGIFLGFLTTPWIYLLATHGLNLLSRHVYLLYSLAAASLGSFIVFVTVYAIHGPRARNVGYFLIVNWIMAYGVDALMK